VSPAERIEAISARLAPINRERRRIAKSLGALKGNAGRGSVDLCRLEHRHEKSAWIAAIRAHSGVLSSIADQIGYDPKKSKRVMFALGLWEMLAETRRSVGLPALRQL
jgi:hypothetical protein